MGRWVSHELLGPGTRFAWTVLLAVAVLALSAYTGRRATRASGFESPGRHRQLRRRKALARRQRQVAARTARRRRRRGRRLRHRRAVQARLHLHPCGPAMTGARAANGEGAVAAHDRGLPLPPGWRAGDHGGPRSGCVNGGNGAHPQVEIAIDISVDVAADLAVGNVPPLPVVYESEITLESGETLDCGIVAPFRTR